MPPRNRILINLVLLLVPLLSLSCNPNPQPEALTPIPTLAPAATLTLIPALEEPAVTGGEAAPSPATEGGDPANGASAYAQNCAACHGEDAQGGPVGPTLVSAEVKAKDDDYRSDDAWPEGCGKSHGRKAIHEGFDRQFGVITHQTIFD